MNVKDLKRILCEYLAHYITERSLIIKRPCQCRIIKMYNFLQCSVLTSRVAEAYQKKRWYKGIPIYEIITVGDQGARITVRIDLNEVTIISGA